MYSHWSQRGCRKGRRTQPTSAVVICTGCLHCEGGEVNSLNPSLPPSLALVMASYRKYLCQYNWHAACTRCHCTNGWATTAAPNGHVVLWQHLVSLYTNGSSTGDPYLSISGTCAAAIKMDDFILFTGYSQFFVCLK